MDEEATDRGYKALQDKALKLGAEGAKPILKRKGSNHSVSSSSSSSFEFWLGNQPGEAGSTPGNDERPDREVMLGIAPV